MGTVLQLMTWTTTGLFVGWLVRTAMRSRRDFGLAGDLTTGWLGGVVGGWLFRQLGVVAPDNALGHVVIALVGASGLLIGVRALRHATLVGRADANAPDTGQPLAELEELVRSVSQLDRRVIRGWLTQRSVVRDPNQAFEAQYTFGERVADKVAQFGGSWTFIGLFFIGMLSWMTMNQEMGRAFDPYPFILLNLVLSCLAALQAPVIMMSQNRQSAKDRSDAKHDYEVNVRAEMQIMALHSKLDSLREVEILRLTQLVEEQRDLIDTLRSRTSRAGGP